MSSASAINLTLDPPSFGAAQATQIAGINVSEFSPQELAMADALVAHIDLSDIELVSSYGSLPQKRMADTSDEVLKQVRTKNLGSVGKDIEDLLLEINNLDTEDPSLLSKIGFVARRAIQDLIIRYSNAQDSIAKIVRRLEEHQLFIMQDMDVLRRLQKANKKCYKELSLYILAGLKRLQQVEGKAAPDEIERFKRRLHDLTISRSVTLQTTVQIELLLRNDQMILEKISSIINNTIPLWKNQIVIALGISSASDAISYAGRVADTTNSALRKNAQDLRGLTSEVKRQSRRESVDLETLRKTNRELLDTISEIQTIQSESRKNRESAELDLRTIEREIKKKVTG